MKKVATVIGIICIVLVAAFFIIKSLPVKEISVQSLDLKDIQDGDYIGEYQDGPVYAKVSVEIKKHQIENIVILEHQNGLGAKGEDIIETIIKQQSFEVDAISGATKSSYVIRKAVELALVKE